MIKVCILQTDNRPSLDYLLETKKVNKRFCEILGYDYLFLDLDNHQYGDLHPATKKIHVVHDFLLQTTFDILVFLDSDAWIQNGYWLDDIVNSLINSEKQGCFSRDPYLSHNTFINSGSFILKNNDFTKKMYTCLIRDLYNEHRFHHNWPFDQHYISNYVFENKDKFVIFTPDILNTPIGKVLRHNWLKNKKMYDDLSRLYIDIYENVCFDKTDFTEKDYYDEESFPNINRDGNNYEL